MGIRMNEYNWTTLQFTRKQLNNTPYVYPYKYGFYDYFSFFSRLCAVCCVCMRIFSILIAI